MGFVSMEIKRLTRFQPKQRILLSWGNVSLLFAQVLRFFNRLFASALRSANLMQASPCVLFGARQTSSLFSYRLIARVLCSAHGTARTFSCQTSSALLAGLTRLISSKSPRGLAPPSPLLTPQTPPPTPHTRQGKLNMGGKVGGLGLCAMRPALRAGAAPAHSFRFFLGSTELSKKKPLIENQRRLI